MWRWRRWLRRVRAASAARCARPLDKAVAAVVAETAVAAVVAEAAVRVVAVRAVYLCLLERVVGVEQVSGLPAAAPQRELRARGLVVRRELTPAATGFGARCWRHRTGGTSSGGHAQT
eukprot:scaffold39300_cov51-Phaeocystis_antarctica.AAC.1